MNVVGPSPWYRHFWPWFIVTLLGVSIVASLATVTIAFRLGDLEAGADHHRPIGSRPAAVDVSRAPPDGAP